MSSPIRVVVVDDHALFRAGMKALLSTHDDIQLCGEAADAESAYTLVESARPDIVLMDIRLSGTDGISAARELRRRSPHIRVLMLSAFSEVDLVSDALAAGARGYLLKAVSIDECIEGIRRVHRGETYLSPDVPFEAREQHRKMAGRTRESAYQLLSNREKEVFTLLVRGWSNSRVARELKISVKTVESHREHILKKLGLHSIVELVRFAARQNLLG